VTRHGLILLIVAAMPLQRMTRRVFMAHARATAAQSAAGRPYFKVNRHEYSTAQVMPDSIAPPKTLAP
jgi:hypothetical protein